MFFLCTILNAYSLTSDQDRGIGRHAVPLRTTKTRTTTNLKVKNNQNWKKIELYGSPTTKELKKKHSSRPVGEAEMGNWAERTHSKVADGGLGQKRLWLEDQAMQQLAEWAVPYLHADKPGGTTGDWDRLNNPGFQCRELKPQNLWMKKPVMVEVVGETPSLTGEFFGETHGPRTYTNPPTQRSVPEGPNLLVVTERVTEIQSRAKQAALFPLRPHPHI